MNIVAVLVMASALRTAGRQVSQTVVVENGVTVVITISNDRSGRTWINATFTPDEPGFHLYSKDLPKQGIRGVGRPTLLEVVPTVIVKPDGPLVANRRVVRLKATTLEQDLPVYPDGAVTLRLPVRVQVVQADSATTLEAAISYMACSKTLCLPAVDARHIALAIPRDVRR